jgi:hypothetical protein
MKRNLQSRQIIGRITVAGFLAAAATCSFASQNVPLIMQVPAGNYVAWDTPAEGVVTYACVQSQDVAGKQLWAVSSAKATLGQGNATQNGTYTSPPETWTAADGSSVTGMQLLSVSADSARLSDQLVIANPADGAGLLSRVTYIQRFIKSGGEVPTRPCNVVALGQKVEVPYQANYVFWKPN